MIPESHAVPPVSQDSGCLPFSERGPVRRFFYEASLTVGPGVPTRMDLLVWGPKKYFSPSLNPKFPSCPRSPGSLTPVPL